MNHNRHFRLGISFYRSVMILIILIIPFFTCCNEKISNTLDSVEACMIDHPDSSLTMLKTIESGNIRTERNRARYALLYSQALDKNHIDLTNDSLINIAVEYYYNRRNVRYKFLSLYYSGRIYSNARDYTKAALAYSDAETLIEKLSDDYLVGLLYSQLGDIYLHVYDYHKSLKSYQQALTYYTKAEKLQHMNYSLADIGIAYSEKRDHENGCIYLNTALEKAEIANDTILAVNCLINLLQEYAFSSKYSKAEEIYCRLHEKYPRQKYSNETSMALANLYAYKQQADSAYLFLNMAWNDVKDINDSVSFYLQSTEVYEKLEQYKKSVEQYSKGMSLQNRVIRLQLQQPVMSIQKDYYKEKSEYNAYCLRSIRIIFIITIVFIILIALILYKQGKMKIELRYERHKDVLKEMDDLQKRYNSNLIEEHLELQRCFNVKLIADVLYSFDTDTNYYNKEKFKIIIDNLISEKSIESLERIINIVNDNIMEKIRRDFPNLKKQDESLLCLILYGFSNSTISILLNKDKSIIATRKSRLFQKLSGSANEYKNKLDVLFRQTSSIK